MDCSPSVGANSPPYIHELSPLWSPKFHYIFQKSPKLPYRQRQHIRPKFWRTCFIQIHDVTYQNAVIFSSQLTCLLPLPQKHPARCTVWTKTRRTVCAASRDSSDSRATRYGLDYPGIASRWGLDFLHRLYPCSLLNNGCRVFPGSKRPGRGAEQPSPPSSEVKERVKLYLYFSTGSSWPALGWTLPLPSPCTVRVTWRVWIDVLPHNCFWLRSNIGCNSCSLGTHHVSLESKTSGTISIKIDLKHAEVMLFNTAFPSSFYMNR
jgi:hypothetical protein